jgi:hypothetical protein
LLYGFKDLSATAYSITIGAGGSGGASGLAHGGMNGGSGIVIVRYPL